MAQSRTKLALKNSVISTGFYFVNLILQFIARGYFLQYLGNEILGLNTTAQNLLQFLNLAELGINTAVGFTLYKPICDNDYNSINEIVSLQGYLYKRIGLMVLLGAIILMTFFPIIFSKTDLPLWYSYAIFSVLLLGALLSYFVNYRQIVLTSSQQDYKVQMCYKPTLFVKLILQIYVVKYTPYGFELWLMLEALSSLASAVLLHYMTHKNFPFLRKSIKSYKSLKLQYADFTKKIKQLFVHKISFFVLSQTSPLIIYAYLSLTVVTYYGNYQMIILGVSMFTNALFNSIGASIGNLVTTEGKKQIMAVFDELFSLRFFVAVVVSICIFCLTPSFISLWIGKEYILPQQTLVLMIIILFIGIIRGAVEAFIFAYGLYHDIWAPLIEATLNLGLSILLGAYWGLNGILMGVICSLLIIVLGWKPYFLFSTRLKGYYIHYNVLLFKHLVLAMPVILISLYLFNKLPLSTNVNLLGFMGSCLVYLIVVSLPLLLIYYFTGTGMKMFIDRILKKTIKW